MRKNTPGGNSHLVGLFEINFADSFALAVHPAKAAARNAGCTGRLVFHTHVDGYILAPFSLCSSRTDENIHAEGCVGWKLRGFEPLIDVYTVDVLHSFDPPQPVHAYCSRVASRIYASL